MRTYLERYRDLVDDFEGFVEAAESPLPTTVRCNTLRTTPRELADRLERLGFAPEPLDWFDSGFTVETEAPGNTLEYLLGLYHPQEEVSMIPPVALAPRPGERVLDLCAAPGSKTTQLSAATENAGCVVANDVSLGRIPSLKSNLERFGCLNVRVTRRDGVNYPRDRFDRVLLDPPCSSEGTCRKDPSVLRDAARRRDSLPGLQRALMRKAASLLRPGGRLVYSTCTFNPEENEAVVAEGMEHGLRPVDPESVPAGEPGVTEWRGEEYPGEVRRSRRYYPHQLGGGGFFVATMRKEAEP